MFGAVVTGRHAFWWSMIFSDLSSRAEASSRMNGRLEGFAQAAKRYPLFGIML
jgi:hypothetical protein